MVSVTWTQIIKLIVRLFTMNARRVWKGCVRILQYWYVFVFVALIFFFRNRLDRREFEPKKFDNDEEALAYIADNIEVSVNVSHSKLLLVTLRNNGVKDIPYSKWQLYFSHLHGMAEQNLACGLALERLDGRVYHLSPIPAKFEGIRSKAEILCEITLLQYSAPNKRMHMPNWYIASTSDSVKPRVIPNTADENLEFVHVQKSAAVDAKNFVHRQRFNKFARYKSSAFESGKIIPTAETTLARELPSITLNDEWIILKSSSFLNAAEFLSKQLNIVAMSNGNIDIQSKRNFIIFEYANGLEPEEYTLDINGTQKLVKISASSPAGAFYGAQSLVSLWSHDAKVPSLLIKDKPRFQFRSLMLDVARNFHTKNTIIELLEVMAMYKLNKFHFHLTDDEGWRVEIPAFPELAKYGSRRCHNFQKNKCMVPSYGSGPDTYTVGSGFYSVFDYRDILKAAEANHIQVIPEIDMPGHAKSALQALSLREEELKASGSDVTSLSFSDLFDGSSNEESPQGWRKNVFNPCLKSTYTFVSVILGELVSLHQGIQDLKIVHLGGDEVQWTIWNDSPACQALGALGKDHTYLKGMFTHKVARIAHEKKLDVAFWNDALLNYNSEPWSRDSFHNSNVYVNFWHGRGLPGNELMTKFADAGYKVILSSASHLYFDHKYDADPEENGQTWATGWIDTHKVFQSIPNSYRLTCPVQSCPRTKHPENFYGMQASLWGEVIRGKTQLYDMLFPRLLALAERAWHQARWESIENENERFVEQRKDWISFANCLGYKELVRLEKRGINYRVPPPIVYQNETDINRLVVDTVYPNHAVLVKVDKIDEQSVNEKALTVARNKLFGLRSVSPVLRRSSKSVNLYT